MISGTNFLALLDPQKTLVATARLPAVFCVLRYFGAPWFPTLRHHDCLRVCSMKDRNRGLLACATLMRSAGACGPRSGLNTAPGARKMLCAAAWRHNAGSSVPAGNSVQR